MFTFSLITTSLSAWFGGILSKIGAVFVFRLTFFLVLSAFFHTILLSVTQSIFLYIRKLIPDDMFNMLLYFGFIDFLRVYFSLMIQAILIMYLLSFFTRNSTN
jgi:hypothetical protein